MQQERVAAAENGVAVENPCGGGRIIPSGLDINIPVFILLADAKCRATQMPLVSIVMPVRNGEKYLRQAVESIHCQTIKDFELILVDDNSTDSTLQIMKKLAAHDQRIATVSGLAQSGLSNVLNYGCAMACAELIARMDADDISSSRTPRKAMHFLLENIDIALCGTHIVRIDDGGAALPEQWSLPTSPKEIFVVLRTKYNCIMHPTVCMRKAAFHEAGGYSTSFEAAEDFELWIRMSRRFLIANLSDSLLLYRVHCDQVSAERSEIQKRSHDAALILDIQHRRD